MAPRVTSGRATWPTGPTDATLGPFLAAECTALIQGLYADQRRWDRAEAERAMVALLAGSGPAE